MKSLRRVQAQRKFAQGAYVPPSVPTITPVRVEEPTRTNIIRTKKTAKRWLDTVSFQSIHSHTKTQEPIVVLERLSGVKRKKDDEDETPLKFLKLEKGVITRAMTKTTTSRQASSSTVRSTSQCTSAEIGTMRDLVQASAAVKEKFCGKCERCAVIMKAQKLCGLLEPAPPNVDVYDFDLQNDEDANHTTSLALLRKQCNSRAPNSINHDSYKIYLHVFGDTGRVVELSFSETKIMSARFVDRKEAHFRDFPLYANEQTLDQLLKILSDSSSLENFMQNGKEKKTAHSKRTKDEVKKFPKGVSSSEMVEAPTFYLSEEELNDPIKFFMKIGPVAEKFGIAKVVAPKDFKPKCLLKEDMEFTIQNQYIARLFSRWGPASREICAMKSYLSTQKVHFSRLPMIDSLEVSLPKLYDVVQSLGGLEEVMEKDIWGRVAEKMRIPEKYKKTIEKTYVKYCLPYDTASPKERQQIMGEVEKKWNRKYKRLQEWASNPLHAQKKLLGESESSEDEEEDDNDDVDKILKEVEDCIVGGRKINFPCFKKVAASIVELYFPNATPSPQDVEKEYWRLVLSGTDHVFVNAASIDTGDGAEGYGFSRNRGHACSKHPWNLKMLSSNAGNVLRSLGNVLGVTVPTLHFGMLFATSCWHRDPHGLPWLEYMHEGPPKIWYGIPDEQSDNFRKAVETLCPTSCQNKSIWLPSDITMIPPNLLQERNVSLSRVVQNPGEFVIVFPKSYSCSICTGFTISESVYFATSSWLKTVNQVFCELRESCEPTTFSLEQLLLALARDRSADRSAPLSQLQLVHGSLSSLVRAELANRRALAARGVAAAAQPPDHKKSRHRKDRRQAWNVRDHDDCQICRCTLYLSKVTGIPDKSSTLCLHHALCLLGRHKYKKKDLVGAHMHVFYTEAQLDEVMAVFNDRLFP